jgi:hypothetical protein
VALDWLPRQEFLRDYWDYRRGQHVALIEPTGGGKTRLLYQLLGRAMEQNPGLDVRVTIPKRRDAGAAAWNAALGLREVGTWPPGPRFGAKPAGYALWPRHLIGTPGDDPDKILAASRANIERQLKICAQDSYQKGDCIHVADDIYTQAVVHKMNPFFNEIWTMGGVMGCGLWGSEQKPTGTREGAVSSFFYNSPKHLFLGQDADERNRDRFGEIGGVDRQYVSNVVQGLQVRQFGDNAISDKLYISKAQHGPYGPAMCIVGP